MVTAVIEKTPEASWLERNVTSWKYHPFIPLSKKDKEKVWGEYRRAVDKYLPLIEQRTGIDMGEVKVNGFGPTIRRKFRELVRVHSGDASLLDKIGINVGYVIAFPILELLRMYMEEKMTASYNQEENEMLVSFGIGTKAHLLNGMLYGHNSNQSIDETILHELTHHLWNRIPKNVPMKDSPGHIVEGYATYGGFDWFSDFLPSGRNGNDMMKLPLKYLHGRNIIEKLVRIHGEEILLEIPTKPKDFEFVGLDD